MVEVLRRPIESALPAPVGVVDEPVQGGVAAPDGHLQCVQGQVGAQVAGQPPADQQAGVAVDDEGGVAEARPGADVGQVGDPQLVGAGGGELPVDQVGRPLGLRIADGGALGLAADRALEAELAHQPLDGAAGHLDALALQLPPDLAGAVHLEVLLPHPLDLDLEPLVALPTRRGPVLLVGVVSAGRQLEGPADRLDPEATLERVDHAGHLVRGWSSWAAK
jgi:hypothetical protein